MKYLLYGIFEPCPEGAFLEPGICAVEAHGLAAAVSLVEETDSAPSVASLLDYERVIEAIHARQAVIPLRYGCLMESESAIVRLLENHSQEYRALLGRLRGTTEMGIRILWPARPGVLPESPSSPGSRYLASLRSRYGSGGSLAPEEAAVGGSDHRPAGRSLHGAAERGFGVWPGPLALAVLSDAENRCRTVARYRAEDLPSQRRETVTKWTLAAVQLRGISWLIPW